jgi:4-hydroxybenzoate polyprenyltransferase
LDGGAITRDELVRRFGERGFDYLGDDRRASPVWATAHTAHVVTTSNHLPQESRNSLAIGQVFSRTDTPVVALIAALRPHQWLKNLLVFVPLVTSHLLLDGTKLFAAVVALVSFSLCASSAYVLNDLVDVQDDRHHRTKRMRAFASGRLSLRLGWIAWPLLLVVGVAISLPILPSHFVVALAAYYVIAVAYSLYLKRKMMMDVVALAVLYTVRIVAGAAAINVALSFWLLTFAMFVFTSLALVKRYAELRIATGGNTAVLPGRQLSPRDLDMVSMLGVAAGYISVMVLALYIQDPETRTLYSHPVRIWPACPILLYWFSRTWMFAHRGWMNEDPVLFAARDRVSFIVVGLIACAFFLAR